MSLEELEDDFRDQEREKGSRLVIISMQIEERCVRTIRPRLESAGVSLSELVRHLIGLKVRALA